MDEILGSNLSKDYYKVGTLTRDGRSLPNLAVNEAKPKVGLNVRTSLDNVQPEGFKFGTPTLKERYMERTGSQDILELYKSPRVNYYGGEQSDRVDNVERTMKYLVDQINNFEKLLYNESRKTKNYLQSEKEHIYKLELAIKRYEDNYSVGNSDLANKLAVLEARIVREEKTKSELREKLGAAEQNQRELLEYLKSLQKQGDHELSQMRGMIQDKMTGENSLAVKEKERSKTLFQEVVRLGEQQEKSMDMIQSINRDLEKKLQAVEAKLKANEKYISELGENGGAGSNRSNPMLDMRVQELENNLYSVTKEQVKDKEMIARLNTINNQLSNDLAQLMMNLNSDYKQNKFVRLDVKVTDLVNKILKEQEDRLKNQSDFKQQIDVRDQINNQISQHEREEMKQRYNSMDALVKSEFERKDTAIRSLENVVETQVRALQAAIKQEQISRNQFESYFRQEMDRFQDETNMEFGRFKEQQTLITEKLTEMIKIEIDTRLSSDIELKNQVNTIARNISQDIQILKEHVETQTEALAKEVKAVAADSAERANQVSRYVDQEISNLNQNFSSRHEKLKALFAKFGEQFKNHLLSTEEFKTETRVKLKEIDQSIELMRQETNDKLVHLEKSTDEKLREQKELLELTIDNTTKVLEDKINKVKEQEEGDVEVLKEAIDNNRNIFNNKLQKLMEIIEANHNKVIKSLKKVIEDEQVIRENVAILKSELEKVTGAFAEDLADLRAYVETQFLNERTIRNQMLEDTYDALKRDIHNVESAINLLRIADDRLDKTQVKMQEKYDEKFHTLANQLSEAYLKLAGLNDNLANFEEKSMEDYVQLVARTTADNLILGNDTKMLFTELKTVVEMVSKENNKTKVFQEKVIMFLVNLSKESNEIKEKIERDIWGAIDNKMLAMLEKVKKQDQELWEKTLVHVNNGFKDAEPFIKGQLAATTKLHTLVMQEDMYQRPVIKPGQNPAEKTNPQQGNNNQQTITQPGNMQQGTVLQAAGLVGNVQKKK